MPIFDNELIDNISNRGAAPERPYLASPDTLEVDISLNPVATGNIGGNNVSRKGMSIDEISSLTNAPSKSSTFSSPMGMARRSELIDNQRYPLFQRGVDLENVYGLQQGVFSKLGNSLAKTGIRAAGTFAQSLTNIPNAISAAKNADMSKLSGNPNGYEGDIDHWVNNFENTIPNYYSRYEREHPHLAMIPGFTGSANFWGESVLKNLGFTAGAIAGAAFQDAAIGVLTEGVGAVPLVANQIGRASLWLNKILSGTNKVDKVLDIAKAAGAGQKALFGAEALAQAAAYTKVANGLRYGTSLVGSAMTEAGVEGRGSYEEVKKTLLENYKLDHPGEDITAEEAAKIEEYATNAMNTRFGINMALLTVSNAIQFDNLFKSFTNAEKGIVGSLTKNLEDAGKIGLKEGSLDVFEKKVAGSASEKIWDMVKPKLTNVLSEGIYEEGGQFAAEKGVYDYYTRKYKNLNDPENRKSWDALNETMRSTSYGLSEQFNSTEGIDNMLIGGLTAVITGGIQGKVDSMRGNSKDARLTSSLNILNGHGLTGILSNKYDNTLNSIGIAKEMENAASSKNIFKYKNLKHDMFFNFVQSRIPSGMHDVTIDQLEMLKDLSKEDFEKTFGMNFNTSNKKTVEGYVDTLIGEANSIKETTDAINDTYKNPFKFIVDPKSQDESLENLKYSTFESWKTDLSYFNSIKTDSNDRLASIQNDLNNINPMLTNAGLAEILDRESLTDLAKSYEEEANRLNDTITEYTSNADKRSTRVQVKALRTNSEKINIALTKSDLDLKTFNSLLNFELNNQDATKEDVVGLDKAPDVYNLGADVVQHNLRKKQAADSFNNLSTKEGFDKYFKQSEAIANDELDEEDLFPSNKKEPTFVNDSKQREKLEVGREYEIDKTRRVNIRKIADDRYQVTAPDGTVSFHKTKESAQEEAKDLSGENTNLSKVKVLGVTEEGLVKVEDVNGDILNIDPKRLRGYRSIETQQEKLAKNKEQLDTNQDEIEKNSGTVSVTSIDKEAIIGSNDKRKDIDILFFATTTESESLVDVVNSAPHIKRARTFLNDLKFANTKGEFKAILVTPNNAEALGLKGIAQLSYGDPVTGPVSEEASNIETGFLAQVYIVQTPDGDFFVDEKGNPVSKVGEESSEILDKVVFQTMSSAKSTTTGGYSKIREGQEEQAERALEAYKIFRQDLSKKVGYTPYPFTVSRGIARQIKINGVREDNHISDILGPDAEKLISDQPDLIFVVTKDKIEHRGELLSFPLGTTLLQYKDLLDFANNKNITNKQANNIFAVIDAAAKDLIDKSNSGKPVKVNWNYSTFLQNVLFWKSKANTTSFSQIGIDTATMSFKIGTKSFPLSEISENKKQITDALQDAFLTVNNTTLSKGLGVKFIEYVEKDGKLETITWPNYQTYLLSSKYPDGSSRSTEDTPLITHTAKPTEDAPSYKQKYSVISGVELPFDRVPVKEKVAVATEGNSVFKIGEYELNNKKENTFPFNTGPVLFTATISDQEVIEADIKKNETIDKLSTDPALVAAVDTNLRNREVIPAELITIDLDSSTNEEKAIQFVKIQIESNLGKDLDAQKAAPKVEAPVVEEVKPSEEKAYNPSVRTRGKINTNNRLVGKDSSDRMTDIEFEMFKEWHAKNVPLIPFEVLDRLITTVDGEKAWGVFEDGIVKFVRGGLKGTEYHEVGEAIWNGILSEDERQAILNDERARTGTFVDRASGKTYDYSDPYVSDLMLKERIMDDFADYVIGKLPARSLKETVRRFFKTIMDFFKTFGTKPSLKEQMFKAIDSGKFKESVVSERAKTLAPQYRAIEGLSEPETNDYIQDMVAHVKFILFEDGKKNLLFNPEKITGKEVFGKLRDIYKGYNEIEALGENRYNQLVKRAVEHLRTMGISLNEEEIASINDDNANQKDYTSDTFTTDWKKNSTGAIKFSLSTLVERKALNQKGKSTLEFPEPDKANSSIGGFKLVNFNRVFATLLDRLSNTNDYEEFTKKIVELAELDSNYVAVFKNLGGDLSTKKFDFENFNDSDWRYFIQFFNTFTKQKPEALIQYITGDGVYTNSANIYSVVNQTVDSWVNNMKAIGQTKGGLINYVKKDRVYKIDSEAIKKLPIKKPAEMLDMLSKIGVEFSLGAYNALSDKESIVKGKPTSEKKMFADAVSSISSYLGKNNDLMSFDAERLDINGPLRTLATLYTRATNPNQDPTYFGVEGQRIGSYSENNAPSYFENDFNESNTLDELLAKRPELKDVYSKGSQVLKKGGLFFNKDGKRIAEIKVEYIQGTENEYTGKNKSTSALSLDKRYSQEINQNINGKYYVLIPADSSTEWMINLGNVISMEDVLQGDHWTKLYSVYNGYLQDEINLALADRTHNEYVSPRAKQLRFMKDILSEEDVTAIEIMIDENKTYDDIMAYVASRKSEINSSIQEYVESSSEQLLDTLINAKEIIADVEKDKYDLVYFDTEFLKKYNLYDAVSRKEVMNFLNFVTMNYEINNIEYHKFIFGDPYQFEIKNGNLSETKRIKSFLSGRRRTFDHPAFNGFLKREYNSINGIELDANTPGYHNYKEYANTVTFSDVKIVGSIATLNNIDQEIKDAFSKVDETDAMSWLMDNTHKEIALKEGQWSDEAEAFHQWHMAYTRRAFNERKDIDWSYGKNTELQAMDAKLLESDVPKYKLAVRKPIVSGNKFNKTEIDLALDKTSQMPLYYKMVEGSSLDKLYVQMFKQGVGYGIVKSGRKVGVETLHTLYNTDGYFNDSSFENLIQIPWKIYGTQVETMSEGEKHQTRGSQLTKMASMDIYDNGEAISEDARLAYERNTKALNLLNINAYNELLKKLGVVDLDGEYALTDGTKISETLMHEMMRRNLSENAKDTIALNEDGQFPIPFEASPSYIQIRSILYSLVNKALISPSMNGAPHVQVPVTMFEKALEGRSLAQKTKDGWKKITKEQYKVLSEEEKAKVMLTDDTLKFYEDEDNKRYCEVMLPSWFRSKIAKGKFKTDEELITYLNSVDGGKILEGIGFRIPTQALSSVEVFKVKGFLPDYMGYTVVVPSEITKKAGSDFDIDKLNMYLKSVYVDASGNLRLVTSKGTEQDTKEFYAKVYDTNLAQKVLKKSELIEAVDILVNGLEDTKGLLNIYGDYILSIQDEYQDPFEFRTEIEKQLDKLTDENLNSMLREQYANTMYKNSLENEYYDSLKELLTLPKNFNRLISPIDDAGLEAVAADLDDVRNYDESTIKGRLINRVYMTQLRHAFVTGKRWVGIAAVNITNLSLRQKSKVYLDPSKLPLLSKTELKFVKDLNIVLPHNQVDIDGKKLVSLSGTKTADGTQFISTRLSGYATAFVDIATNPFITKIIKSDIAVSTFMFLESIGAGNSGIMLMSQPIVEKYLAYLDTASSKSVTNAKNLKYINSLFPTTSNVLEQSKISVDGLRDNIKDYYNDVAFDSARNAEQQLILQEFIKYKILADQLFSYTQATNYDTTRFGSSDVLLKKEWATFNATNVNLISNVQDVLDKTFIGNQADLLSKAFASFGVIMKTESPKIKAYVLSTLKRYATQKYMSGDDYDKVSNLIRNSFLDYVIQTNSSVRSLIKPLLVDSETAIVGQLEQAKLKYPSIKLLNDLAGALGYRAEGAKSIQLNINVKDAYDENMYVGMMRELRDTNPELNQLYRNIVNVAILQGSTQSAISIRNIIPVEDYAAVVAPIINQLTPNKNLETFDKVGLFERNNFANELLFKEYTPNVSKGRDVFDPNTGEEEVVYGVYGFVGLQNKNLNAASRQLLKLSESYNYMQVGSDYVKIPKVIEAKVKDDNGNSTTKKINVATGLEVTKADYGRMKAQGHFDLYDSYYYKKVYTDNLDEFGNRIPLKTWNEKSESYDYYYKLINVYGDGNRAVEHNVNLTPSVIDNGSVKLINRLGNAIPEINDRDVVDFYYTESPEVDQEVVSLSPEEESEMKAMLEEAEPGEQLGLFEDAVTLKDGKDYNKSDVNGSMLEAMGYTPKEIGKILKQIC